MKIYTGVLKSFEESKGSGLIALDQPYQKINEVIFDIKGFNSASKPHIGLKLAFRIKKGNEGIYANNVIITDADLSLSPSTSHNCNQGCGHGVDICHSGGTDYPTHDGIEFFGPTGADDGPTPTWEKSK